MPILMPLQSHRYRIGNCPPQITENAVNVILDFVEQTVRIETRLTVDPESFRAAMQFARTKGFILEFLDGSRDGAHYGLDFSGAELIEHEMKFDYAVGTWAPNVYVFKYQDIGILVPEKAEEAFIPTDGFLTPAEAVAKVQGGETYDRDAGC